MIIALIELEIKSVLTKYLHTIIQVNLPIFQIHSNLIPTVNRLPRRILVEKRNNSSQLIFVDIVTSTLKIVSRSV